MDSIDSVVVNISTSYKKKKSIKFVILDKPIVDIHYKFVLLETKNKLFSPEIEATLQQALNSDTN